MINGGRHKPFRISEFDRYDALLLRAVMNEKDRASAITNSPSISEDRGLSFFQPGATVEVLKRLMPSPARHSSPFLFRANYY